MDVEGCGRLESLELEVQSSCLASRVAESCQPIGNVVSDLRDARLHFFQHDSPCPATLFDIAGSDAILSIHSQVERVLSCCGTHRLVSVLLESRRRR